MTNFHLWIEHVLQNKNQRIILEIKEYFIVLLLYKKRGQNIQTNGDVFII